MKTYILKPLLVIILIYQAITLTAGPAYPGLVEMKQPDGSSISLFLRGDEKVRWMESEDGYSLMYDKQKAIVYAISDEEGNMIPSSIMAKNISLRSISDNNFLSKIPKNLYYSSPQINTLRSIWEAIPNTTGLDSNNLRAVTGKIKPIVALVDFPNNKLVKKKEDFEILFNQAGYKESGAVGSVRDYYLENSYGKMDLEFTVVGPYTLSKNLEYYGENGSDKNDIPERVHQLAKEAADFAFSDPNIKKNISSYDSDKDGIIDGFYIIFAGYGEDSGGAANTIWSHSSAISTLTFEGKKLDKYSCSPELRGNFGNSITNIGVVCHELCHTFGAPDFYDTDGAGSGGYFPGTGSWDLLCSGNWNNNGITPAHINMYQKIKFGWVSPKKLDKPETITNMPNSAENAVAYTIDTATPGEYFVLENRQQIRFDKNIPGTGLIIYRISITDYDIYFNLVNNKHPQKAYIVCANATSNPTGTVASYGSINTQNCPFPGGSKKTSFTDYTTPSATSLSGANTVKPITDIEEKNTTISFKFMQPGVAAVTNLKVERTGQNVKLTWNKPSDNVTGYNIYRNNILLIKLLGKDNTSYTQLNVGTGNHNYCVTAIYVNNESSPTCSNLNVNTQVDGNYKSVKKLSVENVNNNKDIKLSWESPFVSDWVNQAEYITHYKYFTGINLFTAATRYTVEDLSNFYGSKLTKIRFGINDTKCVYTIKVWLADIEMLPSGKPIVEQVVKNPTTTNSNFEVTLTTPVVLESNKELWIGIQYQLNPMTFVAGFEKAPSKSYRNWVSLEADKWSYFTQADSTNWYISGYLQFDSGVLKSAATDNWLRAAVSATPTDYIVYRDGQKITTTKNPQHTDSNPQYGSHIYCVAISYDNGKESEPTCIEAFSTNNTSINSPNAQTEEIEIFPNPIKKGESLIIRSDEQIGSILSIYNTSGKLLQQEQISETTIYKKMDFEPGVYLIQIKSNTDTFIRKIIIN